VGDIESLPYIEAVRQLMWEKEEDCLVIHLTLIPYLSAAGELKTKPTQHSVKSLLEIGVQPDILVCRTEHELSPQLRNKIAKFCNVSQNAVIQSIDAETIYDVPVMMKEEKLDEVVLQKLHVKSKKKPDLKKWLDFLDRHKHPTGDVEIALIGKYVELKDSYKSIAEAFIHAGAVNETRVNIRWVHSEELSPRHVREKLHGVHGILVAPGFGSRGIDGKLEAIRFARETGIPFFGICLGMQMATVEFARNVLGYKDAHSTEMKEYCQFPVISLMAEQKTIVNKGGTMRLGSYPCKLQRGTLAHKAYGQELVEERHRHRFEFNNDYKAAFEAAGFVCSGINPESGLVEIIEVKGHPFFVASQFHPEYKSTVMNPHPLFVAFFLPRAFNGRSRSSRPGKFQSDFA
ncbi:MAG: CTP synthase, partial [Flavobacteriales bacterium]